MADDQSSQAQSTGGAQSTLSIPDDVQKAHGPLIELIKGSESMNDEERQYWINILPIMTPEQIQNLKNILVNEKQQLAAIDKKYEKQITHEEQNQLLKVMDDERKKRRTTLHEKESTTEQTESEAEQELLKEIENL